MLQFISYCLMYNLCGLFTKYFTRLQSKIFKDTTVLFYADRMFLVFHLLFQLFKIYFIVLWKMIRFFSGVVHFSFEVGNFSISLQYRRGKSFLSSINNWITMASLNFPLLLWNANLFIYKLIRGENSCCVYDLLFVVLSYLLPFLFLLHLYSIFFLVKPPSYFTKVQKKPRVWCVVGYFVCNMCKECRPLQVQAHLMPLLFLIL